MCDISHHHCLTSLAPLASEKITVTVKEGSEPLEVTANLELWSYYVDMSQSTVEMSLGECKTLGDDR
jgi:hypothetical protein